MAGVNIEPPLATNRTARPTAPRRHAGQATEYTLTLRNWIGLTSTAKTTVSVVKINAFTASTKQLAQESRGSYAQVGYEGAQWVE